MKSIDIRLAEELGVAASRVTAAVELLDGGATVPFVARYRKEATGGLDDTQLRQLEQRLAYLRDMDARRETILATIADQGKLTPELKTSILAAETKQRLEDLYLPFKPKRRTKSQIAREAGLQPLAVTLLGRPQVDPTQEARRFINAEKGFADVEAVLEGARHILLDHFGENPDLLGQLREYVSRKGELSARVAKGKEAEGANFSDYFDYSEPLRKVPPHRAMALFRGEREGFLKLSLDPDEENAVKPGELDACESRIARFFRIRDEGRPADSWLLDSVRTAWRRKILPHLKTELLTELRERAEAEAISVFSKNLRDLMMAAPAGPRPTMGLDPGLRTGVKVTVVDDTGKLVATTTIYPHVPRNQWQESLKVLAALCRKHGVLLISIGNGTGSRETDRLVDELRRENPQLGLEKVMVSEAGASVYSASELAAAEFPDIDVSLRGAVSIARRLQDPLAELVKIDPKAIGVGQYQHDVNQTMLAASLDRVVEDCVNAVGVDLNLASVPLLARVSGLNQALAERIVAYRDGHGRFINRTQLLKIPRLGARTYQQAAGFLRIRDGENPLDASAVHPEAYPVVTRIAARSAVPLAKLIGNQGVLRGLSPRDFIDDTFGVPTVTDILAELEKPGRDPRGEFRTARFSEEIRDIADLKPGLVLEGVVTNVTNFGAFVDIGVHHDGLVHISSMSDRFVRDPHELVKAGQVIRVKVVQIDLPRRRIGLSMRLEDRS